MNKSSNTTVFEDNSLNFTHYNVTRPTNISNAIRITKLKPLGVDPFWTTSKNVQFSRWKEKIDQ